METIMTTTTTTTPKKRTNRWGVNAFVTFDAICKLLKVRNSEKWMDDWFKISDSYYNPEWTEEENQKAEAEAEAEQWKNYQDAVMSVAERLFGEHHLSLIPVWKGRKHRHIEKYRIQPADTKTWKDAAEEVRQTINGVGYFHFTTLKELQDSGPYTPREVVLNHLHYIPRWQEVYEGGTAAGLVDRELRRH